MRRFRYLIVGGGMTADAAVSGIRELDPSGTIGVISADTDPPYDRPPLTKGLWKGNALDSIWRHTKQRAVDLFNPRTVKSINVERKTLGDNTDEVYSFEKLLIATGGTPRRLSFGGDNILYYRSLRDYRLLRDWTTKGTHFAVLGGGFIGSELAAALAMNNKQVTLLFPGEAICARMFPRRLSQFLNDYYRQKGVQVLSGETGTALERRGNQFVLATRSQREVVVDGVIAGLGITPNVELAKAAGLETADGIVVDEYLRTSHADIYASGDVANFYNPALDRRMRVEHEDNANTMGRIAGRNMAGAHESYDHLPFFYSDLFELGYEAIGELDSRLETVEDWKEPNREGVVYYQKEGHVRGVLLWNVWNQVDAAREFIASKQTFRPEELTSPGHDVKSLIDSLLVHSAQSTKPIHL